MGTQAYALLQPSRASTPRVANTSWGPWLISAAAHLNNYLCSNLTASVLSSQQHPVHRPQYYLFCLRVGFFAGVYGKLADHSLRDSDFSPSHTLYTSPLPTLRRLKTTASLIAFVGASSRYDDWVDISAFAGVCGKARKDSHQLVRLLSVTHVVHEPFADAEKTQNKRWPPRLRRRTTPYQAYGTRKLRTSTASSKKKKKL